MKVIRNKTSNIMIQPLWKVDLRFGYCQALGVRVSNYIRTEIDKFCLKKYKL